MKRQCMLPLRDYFEVQSLVLKVLHEVDNEDELLYLVNWHRFQDFREPLDRDALRNAAGHLFNFPKRAA